MKVSRKIKDVIVKCADYNNKAKIYERTIVEWLEKNNLTEYTASDVTRNMVNIFINCCQVGYSPEDFIEILERLKGENNE